MMRRPPRSTEERLVRAQKSMTPGTLGGRVASAAPMSLDVTRLDPRLRAQKRPGSTGAGFDPNADPVVIGQGANANGGTYGVIIGRSAYNSGGYQYVTAVGWAAYGSALGATAIGQDASAYGTRSTAVGSDVQARGNYDVCIGQGGSTARSGAPGQRNIAIGRFAVTSFAYPATASNDNVAIGSFAEADGGNGIAIGNSAYVSAVEGVAIGYSAYSGAADGTAVGSQAVVTSAGPNGTALGYSSKSQHDHGVAIGYNARTMRDGNIMLGRNATGSQLHLSMNDDDAIYLYDPIDDVIRSVRINSGALVIT